MTDYMKQLTDASAFVRKDAERLTNQLRNEATITDGVIRWNSNKNVPPEDCVRLAAHIGLPIDIAKCDAARDAEVSAFLADYRKARAQRTPEQIAEERAMARAAHGPGVALVNVATGERYTT